MDPYRALLVGYTDPSCATPVPSPHRQSLRRVRQKPISPQGSGFQKWRPSRVTDLKGFTLSNTPAWSWLRLQPGRVEGLIKLKWHDHCTCGLISPYSGRDCVKSLRSSYMGLYPQSFRETLDESVIHWHHEMWHAFRLNGQQANSFLTHTQGAGLQFRSSGSGIRHEGLGVVG